MNTQEMTSNSHKVEITAEDFFRRAHARLGFDVPASLTDQNVIPTKGDPEVDPLIEAAFTDFPLKGAAVLIGVVDRPQPTIILTQRTQHLRSHAGQIAFPGGKIDPEDASPKDAALREAEEEIGLDRKFVEPIGYLDVYPTKFGFRVMPLLARVQPDFTLKISPDEVEDAFEVPLAFLMDPANHKLVQRESGRWSLYEMPFGDRFIWGATAGMLRALYERIYLS